jgi:cytochrome c-type biogenesis protein CcmI
VAYLAAAMIIIGVALFVAAPLTGGFFPTRRKGETETERARLEHERGLAVQGLRELEFDREMGKLSDADYESLHAELERRALTAMAALEKSRDANRGRARTSQVRRIDSARSASAAARSVQAPTAIRTINFCPQCGARSIADAKFCGECGASLRPRDRATGQAE